MFHTELEATNLCTTRCLHCPHESISRPTGRMTWETYEAVIRSIRLHTRGERFSVSFSGMGEPTLNPLIFRFIRHISAEATTSFATNGAALSEPTLEGLMEAGLDTLYLSFNGDTPEGYARMMGGLPLDKALANLRRAVALCKGTRLNLRANVSITKANRDRVDAIGALLAAEGIGDITYSLCHNRGGNLTDPAVCDTPAMDIEHWACDVMANTLFVDWQGRAHICDHDLHGAYVLGDLLVEPLGAILERRARLVEDSSGLKICRQCNDVLRIGGTFPLESRSGGTFRDWIYYLHRQLDDPLSEASAPLRWIYRIYEKEGRVDRFANRLLEIECLTQAALRNERAQFSRDRCAHERDREALVAERARWSVERAALKADRQAILDDCQAIRTDRQAIQAALDRRDAEFAALHADYCLMRRDWGWRIGQMLRRDLARLRSLALRILRIQPTRP